VSLIERWFCGFAEILIAIDNVSFASQPNVDFIFALSLADVI
jgi:hypothetical protein